VLTFDSRDIAASVVVVEVPTTTDLCVETTGRWAKI